MSLIEYIAVIHYPREELIQTYWKTSDEEAIREARLNKGNALAITLQTRAGRFVAEIK